MTDMLWFDCAYLERCWDDCYAEYITWFDCAYLERCRDDCYAEFITWFDCAYLRNLRSMWVALLCWRIVATMFRNTPRTRGQWSSSPHGWVTDLFCRIRIRPSKIWEQNISMLSVFTAGFRSRPILGRLPAPGIFYPEPDPAPGKRENNFWNF